MVGGPVSDRQDQILTAIDATLAGYVDQGGSFDEGYSHDAMRWSPAEASRDEVDDQQVLWQRMVDQAALYGRVTAIVRGGVIAEVLDGSRVEHHADRSYAVPYEVMSIPVEVFTGLSDAARSLPVHISPAEAMIPGPNRPIHIRGAYDDQPAQVTEIDLDSEEDTDS
jgi:hypothetical protein